MRYAVAICLFLALPIGIALSQTRHRKPSRASGSKSGPAPTPSSSPEINSQQSKSAEEVDPYGLAYTNVGDSNFFNWSFRSRDIFRQPDGSVKVWVKRSPISKMEVEARRSLREEQLTFDENKYHHTLMLYRVRCVERIYQTLARVDYGTEGEILYSGDYPPNNDDWVNAVPNSIGEAIVKAVCP